MAARFSVLLRLWILTLGMATSLLCTAAQARDLSFYIYTGIPNQKAYFVSELLGWDSLAMRMEEETPGFYSIRIEEPWLHKLEYKFFIDGKWSIDPWNQDRTPDGKGSYNSIIAIEGFREDPALFPQRGVSPWKRKSLTLTDLLGRDRTITVVYPPAEIQKTKSRSATIYFQDGDDYLNKTGVTHLLANLSQDPNMPLLTGVFIPPKGDRIQEYSFTDQSEKYMEFVVTRVVRVVERFFPTQSAHQRRLVMGASMGGLISLQTAIKYPEVFSLAASQSGATWYKKEKIIPMISAAQGSGLKLFLEVGIYEDDDMLESNRKTFLAAQEAGLKVIYEEYPSTHDWIAWRNRLNQILRYFFDQRYQ